MVLGSVPLSIGLNLFRKFSSFSNQQNKDQNFYQKSTAEPKIRVEYPTVNWTVAFCMLLCFCLFISALVLPVVYKNCISNGKWRNAMYGLAAKIGNSFRAAGYVKIEGKDAIALFDTGATVSVISDRLAAILSSTVKWTETSFSVNAVNGLAMHFAKRGRVSLRLGSQNTTIIFHVMKNCPYDCIIGTDFLKDLSQVTFDFRDNVLRLPRDVIVPLLPSNTAPDTSPSLFSYVMVNEQRTIPPWSEIMLEARIDGWDGRTALISAGGTQEKLARSGIFVARSLSVIKKGKVPVHLVNTRGDEFKLYSGTRIAQAEFNLENQEEAFSVIHAPVQGDQKAGDPSDPLSSLCF